MSNKSSGTAFEREWAQMLADHGFWTHCLKDNANGQPFDVIASRNGIAYVFDCKECASGRFQLSRIEENQKNAMTLWRETGNTMGMFVLKFEELIILVPYRVMEILQKNRKASISKAEACWVGWTAAYWFECQDRLNTRWEDAGHNKQ